MPDRAPLPPDALTLPAKYYTDPTLYAREQDIFFRQMWVCAGRLEELPARGSFIARHVAGNSLLIVRTNRSDAPPAVAAFQNVCRHRGTQLCQEASGTLAGAIQCEYHAWTYDFAGKLVGAPHMEGSVGFRKDDYPLFRVRAGVWDGFIFVCADDTAPGLEAQLAGVRETFRPWRMGDLQRGDGITYDIAANWKLIIQNFSECLHCPNLHPVLNRLSHYMTGDNEPFCETYMGGRMDLGEGVQTMSMDGTSSRGYLPGLSPEEHRRVYYYAVFPNLLISAHPDYVMVHTLWPTAPDRTRLVCEWLFDPDELARPGFTSSDVREFWDMTNRQDWHVCEGAQAGISARAYQPGRYSNREELLYAFDRFIVSRLGE